MMEKTDKKEDDARWQMKTNIIKENGSDEWKNRRAVPLVDLQLAKGATLVNGGTDYSVYDEGHTRIMASLVPDEIIYNISDYSKREFDGCILFGDVSGFTDLSEKYNKCGNGGPSRLTQVLNNYIGAMVQEILSHNGDVLKFSGDAFIALWKVTDQLSMRDAIHEAIDCSLVIQKTYGKFQTDIDVVVRVKLTVVSGHLMFSLIGDEETAHYIMIGQPINDIKAADAVMSAGEIIVTSKVSRHLSANEYLIDILPDGLHAKVLGVGPNWRNIQRQYDDKDAISAFQMRAKRSLSFQSVTSFTTMCSIAKNEESVTNSLDDEVTSFGAQIVNDQYALRPAVNHAARIKLTDQLRRFIIAPVVRGIDTDEPLEYLTEIRQVGILLINCKVPITANPSELIDIANNVYTTVCKVVKGQYGCVNKISIFDKDLMLLIIFGLRGFKHELESQIALKCATECYDKISLAANVLEVSCGVTTGKCYCGAFGHTLRREYTVIGLVVNKAARLMMRYPNKVTCDRETFLHSKLEARNFILQAYVPLKGLANPGPIYQFKEVERTHELGASISPHPLLGREKETDLYKSLLSRARFLSRKRISEEYSFTNMLIIQGDFRQGKTRLLEEVLYTSDHDIPVNTFSLTKYDHQLPYRTIQQIFSPFIGNISTSIIQDREARIAQRLKEKHLEKDYSFLNKVFQVDFKVYKRTVTEEAFLASMYEVFTSLCHQCFTTFGIIAIDDAEYIDDESWMLIQIMLDLNLVMIVATMGLQKEITTYAMDVLKNIRIMMVQLKPIDKWYHVGLACQMLDIDGIPPELEKAIQLRSNGNPGWIESFLITLVQSGGLKLSSIKRINAYNSGVVIPPLYMIMRLSEDEINLWMDIMEERTFAGKNVDESTRWKMFVDSCRESYPDLAISKTFSEYKKNKLIKICSLDSNFNLDDVEPELHIDVVILKTFDSLTSYEQLLLKCSSILGDIFPRDMLLYIMSSSAIRLTAQAVQKLFEIQVLSCARGNFLEGGLNFKDRLMNPNDDLSVKCDCIGLLIDEACEDLPKYASCGYIRFRSSEFRETTYNLLTDNQKREFHERAIRYLEKATRRCRACGNGFFARYMGGGRLDEGLKTMRFKTMKSSAVSIRSVETHSSLPTLGEKRSSYLLRSDSENNYTSATIRMRDTLGPQNLSFPDVESISESNVLASSRNLGFASINKLKDNYNLTKTFSACDYSQCTCLLILNSMYSHLIAHCKGAGLAEKVMCATIEYAYVCLENKNAPEAIKVLEEALLLLDGPMKDQLELEWMVSLKKGKLNALLGKGLMNLEDDIAIKYLKKALNYYGVRFPITNLGKRIHKHRYKLIQMIRLYLIPGLFCRSDDEDMAEYCNNVSECLSFVCTFFIQKGRWKEAELAATWSLTKAAETETDFEKLCAAYTNMIYIASMSGQYRFCIALEVSALQVCHRKKTVVELEELKTISELYFSICRARILRAEVEKTLHIAYIIWRIATSCRSVEVLFTVLPTLAYANLMKKQIVEFGTVLTEIKYLVHQDTDNSGKNWYYALCIILHLETGLIAETIPTCNQFIQGEGLEETVRDPTGKKQMIVALWLWEIRNENWEAATVWQHLAWKYDIRDKGEDLQNLITGLYLVEGLIIYMVNKMDMKNLKASTRADAFICYLFKKFDMVTRFYRIIIPRLLHMKAYYRMSKYNDYIGAIKILKRARKVAEKQHNEIEFLWIQHSEQAWTNKLSPENMYFWRNHCDEETFVRFHDVEFNDKFVQYSLPLPLYM